MSRSAALLLLAAVAAVFVLYESVFFVDQTERALIIELGRPASQPLGPGLGFKLPIVQSVVFFDARLLEYDAKPAEILTRDKKNMVVDNYAKWRIADPLAFYATLRDERRAQARLDDVIYGEVRVALGNYTLDEVVAVKRDQIMAEVRDKVNGLVKGYGVEIADVRIRRTDLPPENERAIFGRMRAERERQAKQYRSEGQEEAAKIRSGADRERTVALAEAERQAAALRGQGEAEAAVIYAKSLNAAPAFYSFYRSMQAYQKSVKDNAALVLTPESRFLRHLK